jgi:hypothetical protein
MNLATPFVPAAAGAQQAALLFGTMSSAIAKPFWSAAARRRFHGAIHPFTPSAREANLLSDLRAPSASSVLNSEAFSLRDLCALPPRALR